MSVDQTHEKGQTGPVGSMAGSAIQLAVRRDDGTPRLGFWHRNEMTALPEGGMRMTIIPDPQGPYFTTICTFDYYNAQDWPERIVASLANKKDDTDDRAP